MLRRHERAAQRAAVLEPDEELAAAAVVADGRAAENELAAVAGRTVAGLDAVASLRDRIQRGEAARRSLIDSSRSLVPALARRHPGDAGRTVALLAAGDDALTRAVDRYDPTGGLPFSAFARWWVERAMRELEHEPAANGSSSATVADTAVLTALGHLAEDDCRIVELRLGLGGGPPLSAERTAEVLGMDPGDEEQREHKALAKLRHPCTPGDLTHLRRL